MRPADSSPPSARRIAVIGGGWAGMAAAVALQQQGHSICLWEAARHWGGRARALEIQDLHGQRLVLDNGQHILIGAYQQCLALMQTVGVLPEQVLRRLPLDLRLANGLGLRLPDLAPPWDALLGIASARGWSLAEKFALLGRARRWQRQGFACAASASVAELCAGLSPRLMDQFIDPLCISALNLPANEASGALFLRVLGDALFSGRGGSHLLLPQVSMGALFPEPAADWLLAQGAQLQLGQRVQTLAGWPAGGWQVNGQTFDAVVLASACGEAARLVRQIAPDAVYQSWADQADSLGHTAIATVYAQVPGLHPGQTLLPAPMVALASDADRPAQFAFDRGQLGGPAGLLALVISASGTDRLGLQNLALEQARQQLALPGLQPLQTVVEKRAAFACRPGVRRPGAAIAPGLWACGDYVAGPYPATLEGAVLSGLAAAKAIHGQAST